MQRLTGNMRQVLLYLLEIAPDEVPAIEVSRGGGIKQSSAYSGIHSLHGAKLIERRWVVDQPTGVEVRAYRLTPNGVVLARRIASGDVKSANAWRPLVADWPCVSDTQSEGLI